MTSAAVQQQPQQYQPSPAYSHSHSPSTASASRHPRSGNANPDSLHNTPTSATTITPSRAQQAAAADTMAQPAYDPYYQDSRGQPMNLPIRSAAQQQPQTSPAASSYDARQHSARPQHDSAGYVSEGERERRRTHRSPHESPAAPNSGRSQRTRQPAQSRSQTAIGQPPIDTSLPRENSAIINHIVVDDPQSDIARERARVAEARPVAPGTDITPVTGLGLVGEQGVQDADRAAAATNAGQRSRQEHLKSTSHRKEVKFGDYILGQTLGEGEFGKVKMGWKKEGGVQVAIKLIRKESLAGNNTRLPKIYREISILKELEHPNIVRLHEFVETERHMGIILEYASGGELFDYILNHRYLKDPAARRLFAQLVSGVGYLHKKGIVHRDLKLENLLLDRYKNIIITDFGFANTFSPNDELGEQVEHRIADKDFVKREGLDAVGKNGHRRGDLMQTSCGSPCYAAPELVVSDGLYTGRKVDVWSCGVILYAMLAGYLPFDDDPANPEGDNINLLYKYIVSTPLTFPEYVTPHARDLLRRILVPDPRRRADLFEVARHSWLSEYGHLVGFIGSNTKSDKDIAKSALRQGDEAVLGRSASVREPTNRSPVVTSAQRPSATDGEDARSKQRDTKRRTVQVEYVAPGAGTPRSDASPTVAPQATGPISGTGRTRARADSQGPVEVQPLSVRTQGVSRKDVPPHQVTSPNSRSNRDNASRVTSEPAAYATQPSAATSRPNTRGTLPSRGNSYSQPVAATPTTENAQGRFSQPPKPSPGYIKSGPTSQSPVLQSSVPQSPAVESRPGSHQNFGQFQQPASQTLPQSGGHKRSSTLSSITDRVLGRSNSRRKSQALQAEQQPANEKRNRKYPPVSMRNAMPSAAAANPEDPAPPRKSTDSRRSSFQFLRRGSKNFDAPTENKRSSRRFSFLPSNFSMNSFSGKKDQAYDSADSTGQDGAQRTGRPASKGMAFGRGTSRSPSEGTNNSNLPHQHYYESDRNGKRNSRVPSSHAEKPGSAPYAASGVQRKQFRDDGYGGNLLDNSRQERATDQQGEHGYSQKQDIDSRPPTGRLPDDQYSSQQHGQEYRADGYGSGAYGQGDESLEQVASNTQNIRPQQRKFGDAYDRGHDGSSSGARRVMDFFRRRGKERGAKE